MTEQSSLQDVEAFVAKLTVSVIDTSYTKLEITEGPKYFRIVAVHADQRSVYAFVERATGNVLKSATWKTPAKGVRGNIFNENPTSCCGPYGAVYFVSGRRAA
jgi:hypothetical protein